MIDKDKLREAEQFWQAYMKVAKDGVALLVETGDTLVTSGDTAKVLNDTMQIGISLETPAGPLIATCSNGMKHWITEVLTEAGYEVIYSTIP